MCGGSRSAVPVAVCQPRGDCRDPALAVSPDRGGAARRPDLVIHLGDYYYREKACPAGRAGLRQPLRRQLANLAGRLFDPAARLRGAVGRRPSHMSCAGAAGRLVSSARPLSGPLLGDASPVVSTVIVTTRRPVVSQPPDAAHEQQQRGSAE
jgi:hypothetical protein